MPAPTPPVRCAAGVPSWLCRAAGQAWPVEAAAPSTRRGELQLRAATLQAAQRPLPTASALPSPALLGACRGGPGATEGGGTEKLRTEGVGGSFPLHRNICLLQALPPSGETLLSKRELRRKAPDGRYPGSPTVATVPGLLRRFGFVQQTAELRVKTRNYPNWARGLF